MSVSGGTAGPSGHTGAPLPNQSQAPSPTSPSAYANALTTASGDQRTGAQAADAAKAETRSEKTQLAKDSTSAVARSMGGDGHTISSPGRSAEPKSSSAYHHGRDEGGARSHARSSASSDSHKGQSTKRAGSGGGGSGEGKSVCDVKKRKEGASDGRKSASDDKKSKQQGDGDKAAAAQDKRSEGGDKGADGRALVPQAGTVTQGNAKWGSGKAWKVADMAMKEARAAAALDKAMALIAQAKSQGKAAETLSALASQGTQSPKSGRTEAGSQARDVRASHHHHATPQQQTPVQPGGVLQANQGAPAEAAQQQPGGVQPPTPHHQAHQQIVQSQAAHQSPGDYQHHHGGLGVSTGGKSPNGGAAGWDRTALGQGILSLLFGMQNVESEAGRCAMAEQACTSCAGSGSDSEFAGGTSSLEQLLQLLKELVSRSARISGGEKHEIFGLIDRLLLGRSAPA